MKSFHASALLMLYLLFLPSLPLAGAVDGQCRAKGVLLHGKVKVVKQGADLKVKKVTAFPDLKVQKVTAFPDKCGQWKFVDAFPDFTIQYEDSFPDLKIQMVSAFPGRP